MTSTPAERFRELHVPGSPLLLPNAWDHASGAALVEAGFAAIGTTSLGVAVAAGLPDGRGVARDATVLVARLLARLPCLVTADIEGGFSEDPAAVADVVAELSESGVVGVNLEDGRDESRLAEPEHQARLIAAVKARVPGMFVNARVDTYWLAIDTTDPQADTLSRVRRYVDAGADGVFVPSLPDDAAVRGVVEAADVPLNVLYQPDRHTIARLADLGVARVSTGSLLFRAALHATVVTARTIREAGTPDTAGIPTYAEARRLAGR